MFLVHNLTPSQDKILNWLCSNVPLYDIIILKKRYSCFSPYLNRYLVSINISFFEYVLYYTNVPSTYDICNYFPTISIFLHHHQRIPRDASPTPLHVYQHCLRRIEISLRNQTIFDG